VETITFKELEISSEILRALEEMGFESPSEIQQKAIPVINNTELDFIGQAQTGTGKTAAFVIPLLEKIKFENGLPQAIILAPTRELANQVEQEIKKIGKYTGVRTLSIYGGTSYDRQIRGLKNDKPHIVVGTPGRVIDLIDKNHLRLKEANYCILDEADEMLNMGFLEDVQKILEELKSNRQLIMFSATMPRPILQMVEKSFNEYEMVKIKKKTLSNEDIDQKYFVVKNKYQKESLVRLIDSAEEFYGIVFCKTRLETKEVGDELKERGYKVEILNGDMGQAQRDHAMRNFKDKRSTIMVCTDVAARGIDVNNLTHVVNFGLPQDNESYVHRIGRTGRAGMKGEALTIVTPNMQFAIKKIERLTKQEIKYSKLPTVAQLKKNLVDREIESAIKLKEAVQMRGDDFKTDESFETFESEFGDLSQKELMRLMFTWKFNKELRHFDNLPDIESSPNERSSNGGGRSRRDRRSGGRRSDRRDGRRPDRREARGGERRRGAGVRTEGRSEGGRSDSRRNDRRSERRSERFASEGRSERGSRGSRSRTSYR
jgi:ATP-dependent RNA helicase DeaD